MSNETHGYVDPGAPNPREIMRLVLIIIGLIVGFYLFGMVWATWGEYWAFGVLCGVTAIASGVFIYLRISHHQMKVEQHEQEMLDREMKRELSASALENDYSVEWEVSDGTNTQRVVLTSPYTIPQGPITQIYEEGEEEEQQALPEPLPNAPPFERIESMIGPGHLFLGQHVTGARWGDIIDLLSVLIAGRPGQGKSTLLRNVCGQVLLIGGKPIIFDPHGSIVDDLGGVLEAAETERTIDAEGVRLLDLLERRLGLRRAGQRIFQPVLLLADELPVLAAMSGKGLEAVKKIVLEGRKVGMFALVSGQGVPASLLGGTMVRDSMSSRYVFATSAQQARLAGLENETAKAMMERLDQAGEQSVGRAVLATRSSIPQLVAIPNTTTEDIRRIVQRKRVSESVSALETALDEDAVIVSEDDGNVSRQEDSVSVESASSVGNDIRETIKRMRRKGMKHREIAVLVGLAGRKYDLYKAVCVELGITVEQEAQ